MNRMREFREGNSRMLSSCSPACLVIESNPTLANKLLISGLVMSVLTLVATIMYQNEMRKWRLKQARKHQDSSDSVEE